MEGKVYRVGMGLKKKGGARFAGEDCGRLPAAGCVEGLCRKGREKVQRVQRGRYRPAGDEFYSQRYGITLCANSAAWRSAIAPFLWKGVRGDVKNFVFLD